MLLDIGLSAGVTVVCQVGSPLLLGQLPGPLGSVQNGQPQGAPRALSCTACSAPCVLPGHCLGQ